jgi:Holliday junction resolvase YEN1
MEKVILWRILSLLRLNIQLLFVSDGMRKPGKTRRKGVGGGKTDDAVTHLLHRLLDLLQIPRHRAPGEAEAECALLQRLAVVDAVWSDDGDCFMFGCQMLIRAYKQGNESSKTHVRVYRASDIQERLDLDADSVMLFAVLAGGDYDNGLYACGPQLAKKLARRDAGLAQSLRRVNVQSGLVAWRVSLKAALYEQKSHVVVPDAFPPWKALLGYEDPAVSTHEQAHDLRGLRGGWKKDVNQPKLRTELRQRYNFQTREFLKHIAPILLVRVLARCDTADQRTDNMRLEITSKTSRQPDSEKKILFNPLPLLSKVDVSFMPDDEDWSKFEKQGIAYDPLQKVECTILECVLRNGLPENALDIVEPTKRRSEGTKSSGKVATDPGQLGDEYKDVTANYAKSDDTQIPTDRARKTKAMSPPKRQITSVEEPSDITIPASKRKRREPTCSQAEASPSSAPPHPTFRRLQLPDFSKLVRHDPPPLPATTQCRPNTIRELRTSWLTNLEASSPAAATQPADLSSSAKSQSQCMTEACVARSVPRAASPIVIDLT